MIRIERHESFNERRPNFYTLLLGQSFVGDIPSMMEMPASFIAPPQLTRVAREIISNPEFWQRECSTLGFVGDKDFQLWFTGIKKGAPYKPGKVLSVGRIPTSRHLSDFYINADLKKFSDRKKRLFIHTHPGFYHQYDAPSSKADLCDFLSRAIGADGRIDFVSADPTRFNPDWWDWNPSLPKPEIATFCARFCLFVKNREFEREVAPRLIVAALKNFTSVASNLSHYLYDFGWQKGRTIDNLRQRLRRRDGESPTVFSYVSIHSTALSEIFILNGISSYVALFNKDSEDLVFHQVPRDSLEEFGEPQIHQGTGLLLPETILMSRDQFGLSSPRSWERSSIAADRYAREEYESIDETVL